MKSYSLIIQGEGKGHFSQAATLVEHLSENNSAVKCIYLGRSFFRSTPDYFSSLSDIPLKKFFSPNFIRTTNRKGIRLLLSFFLNILFGPIYIFEACRIGLLMRRDKCDIVYNFYDPIGGLASRWWGRKKTEFIAISHHFYLSHPDFIHPHGMEKSFFWLQYINRFMMRSADRVLALSFRKGTNFKKIEVVPPLLDSRILESKSSNAGKDLCYFLNPGFVSGMLAFYCNAPEIQADIYTEWTPGLKVPGNVTILKPSRSAFIKSMKECNRIITTAGFDTAAEAFYLGIPVYLIPTENHYEQYCNALDASRTGMAFQLDSLSDLLDVEFSPARNTKFIEWVNSGDHTN
jgi:uncharacterized protein (TIGR00661 family)